MSQAPEDVVKKVRRRAPGPKVGGGPAVSNASSSEERPRSAAEHRKSVLKRVKDEEVERQSSRKAETDTDADADGPGGEGGVSSDTRNKPKSVSFVINEVEPHFKTLKTLLRFSFGKEGVTVTDGDLLRPRADKWARCLFNDGCRSISQCEIPTAPSTRELKIAIIETIQKHFVDHHRRPPREELSRLKEFLDSKYNEITGLKQQREIEQMEHEEDQRKRRVEGKRRELARIKSIVNDRQQNAEYDQDPRSIFYD